MGVARVRISRAIDTTGEANGNSGQDRSPSGGDHSGRAASPGQHARAYRLGEPHLPVSPGSDGQRADGQVRRGVPREAALLREREHRRRRAACDRPDEGDVRLRARQRSASQRDQREHRGVHGGAEGGRQDHGNEARTRGTSLARNAPQLLGEDVRGGRLRGGGRQRSARHGPRPRDRAEGAAGDDRGGCVGVSSDHRLRGVRKDRR